jgi:ABC-type amino acid transport substrate-binding protein
MRFNLLTVFLASLVAGLVTAYAVLHQAPGQPVPVAVKAETAFERVARTRTLRCAYISWSASYFMKDPNTGVFQGVGYDLAEALADNLKLTFEWTEEVGLGTMYEGLGTRYDAICTPVFQDGSGGTHALFTTAAYYAPLYGYARADDTRFNLNDPHVMEKLNAPDVTVVDAEGSNATIIHDIRYPNAKTLFLPGMTPAPDIIGNVTAGKADITQQNPIIVEDFLKANPGTLKRVTPPLMTFPLSLMVLPIDDEKLKNWLDLGVNSLVESGVADKILDKYDPERTLYLRRPKPYVETAQPH